MTDLIPAYGFWVLVTVASAGLAYLVFVHLLLRRLFSRFARQAARLPLLVVLGEHDKVVANWVAAALGLALVGATILISLALAGVDIRPATIRLEEFGLSVAGWLGIHGVRIAIIVVVAYLIHRSTYTVLPPIIRAGLVRGKAGLEMEEAGKRSNALAQVTQYAVSAVVVVIAFIMVMAELGFNLAPILAGVGIAGIAIGFGAQNLVRDVIAGIFILLEDQYRVGDVASVGGKTGLVEGVNLRRTILRDLDGIVHIVPNGQITVASNFTKSFSRVNLDISVAYKEDLNHVFRVLNRVGNGLARDEYFGSLILEPPQVVRVNNFDDSGIAIKVVGVTKPIRQWEVMGELRRRIKEEFDKEGIEIPFPHRTVYWGVESHPRSEPAAYNRGSKHRSLEESISQELRYRDPWVQEAAEVAPATMANGAGGNGRPNMMAHLDEVRQLLISPPTGLFTDIDGSLATIAPNPKLAKIAPAVRQALGALSQRMTVAVLTGRDVASARAFLGLTSTIYCGNHGVETWERGNTTTLPEAQALKRQIQKLAKVAKNKLASQSGILVEDKGLSLALHFRQATDPYKARQAVLEFLAKAPQAEGLTTYEGKMVIETHVPFLSNKGTALQDIVEKKGLRSALVIGDDATDIYSFQMLAQLRSEGTLLGLSIAVLGSETPSELLAVADYTLADAESVELFLMWMAEEVRKPSSQLMVP